MNRAYPAYPAFAILGLIWGTNFLFMKWASALITPTQIVFLRVLFGFIPLFIYALFSRSLQWRHLRYAHHFLVMSVLATVVYYYAFAKGASLLPSSVAGMLSGAIPLFAFVCAWALLRQERPTARMIGGVICGFAGVLLIARPWATSATAVSPEGVLSMVIGSLSVGCSFVYARRFITTLDMSPVALSTYQIGLSLLIIVCITNFRGITRIELDSRALIGLVLGLGVLGTGIAYIIYYYIVHKLGAVAASAVTYIPPIIALLMGALFAHEAIRPLDLLAMSFVLGGVYFLQTGQRKAIGRQALKRI
jgi:drug/metabolite transporter (DMT)-like permease